MPSIAEVTDLSSMSSSPVSMKKRKREQRPHADENDHIMLGSAQHTLESHPLYNTELLDHTNNSILSQPHRLLLKSRSMRSLRAYDSKRQRILLSGSEASQRDSSNTQVFAGTYNNTPDSKSHNSHVSHHIPATSVPHTKVDLSSCHICHQKPKVKTDLDSYADCDGCGKRTCYICMRECEGPSAMAYADGIDTDEGQMSYSLQLLSDEGHIQTADKRNGNEEGTSRGEYEEMNREWPRSRGGPSGHRAMVCSSCCVERGPDGEVRCLGCLRMEEVG